MPNEINAAKRIGFLTRLRKDERGNTLAMFAAAIFPMAGLVGGAVDMGRVYAVKTRLQAACDAGSLAGRKVMGNGKWNVDNNTATDDAPLIAARQMFDANYASDYLGTTDRTRGFTESSGTVTGTASANVPMTLLRLLGQGTRNVAVTCNSMMKIPNTDVMFVLDVTGSMNDRIQSGDALNKMDSLRLATRCFYEALARQNIPMVGTVDPAPTASCNQTAAPVGDLSNLTQLRFGFVPFSSQINIGYSGADDVGFSMPVNYMKDNQTFYSRKANTTDQWTWDIDSSSISDPTGNGTPATMDSSYYALSTYSGSFTSTGSTGGNITTTTPTGGSYARRPSTSGTAAQKEDQCNKFNKMTSTGSTASTGSASYLTGIKVSEGAWSATVETQNPAAPVYGTHNIATVTKTQTKTVTVVGYWYDWDSGNSRCQLYQSSKSYNKTRSATASNLPIDWTQYKVVNSWSYGQYSWPVSKLKKTSRVAGTSPFESSLSLPLGDEEKTLNKSGSSSSSDLDVLVDVDIPWNGCIEEQQTFKNTDGNPSDDWGTIPSTAYDMDLGKIPSTTDEATRWGFMLPDAVWTSTNSQPGDTCPTESRPLETYSGTTGATAFSNYIGSLMPVGSTYHDIGLMWGGRLINPNGVLANTGAVTNTDDIQRHLIFMTDGITQNTASNYTPYGVETVDHRRTNATASATLEAITNAKTTALCAQIKNLGNQGVTVWVVYYGVLAETDPTYLRLRACATSTNHFFLASSTSDLLDSFNDIADAISELKLTS